MVTPGLDQLFRDTRCVVVAKPSGLSVHRGWDASFDTVLRRLRGDLGAPVHPVHRLDRGTSGALLLALDPEAASALGAAFREGHVDKEYVALARGPLEGEVQVDRPIGGAPATTIFSAIALARDRYCLVRARPLTGRSHQIRLHLRHLRRPILGDTTYGDGRENRKLRDEVGLCRLALHATRIRFPHPATGEAVEVVAPLPEDLAGPFERLGLPAEELARLGAHARPEAGR